MVNMILDGADWLASVQASHAGTTVTYSRSGVGSVSLTAVAGERILRLQEGSGSRLEFANRDFIVVASELSISGSTLTPTRGDRITIADTAAPDNGVVYEVQALPGEPPFRQIEHGQRIRIHTRKVS